MRTEMLALREWTKVAPRYQIGPVKTIDEIRHGNLLILLKGYKTIQAFATAIERSHSQVSQWKNRSKRQSGGVATIDSGSARHIDDALHLGTGWMDVEHSEHAVSRPESGSPRLPPRDFQYRQEVDESDWDMLQDISALPKEERDSLKEDLKQKTEKYRRFAEEIIGKLNK